MSNKNKYGYCKISVDKNFKKKLQKDALNLGVTMVEYTRMIGSTEKSLSKEVKQEVKQESKRRKGFDLSF